MGHVGGAAQDYEVAHSICWKFEHAPFADRDLAGDGSGFRHGGAASSAKGRLRWSSEGSVKVFVMAPSIPSRSSTRVIEFQTGDGARRGPGHPLAEPFSAAPVSIPHRRQSALERSSMKEETAPHAEEFLLLHFSSLTHLHLPVPPPCPPILRHRQTKSASQRASAAG